MTVTATGTAEIDTPFNDPQAHSHGPLGKLMLGAIGIVYGDIGTSPIYAFRETFAGHHELAPDSLHIYGILSLIFWSMMIIVTLKYVTIIMRADNKGEGGSLALLALINRSSPDKKRWTAGIVMLGVFATALFYGDSMITPAISVLSAVEGLTTVSPLFDQWVIPLAIGILIGLFAIQKRGTARVGLMFGPIMMVYFGALAVLGAMHIVDHPQVILAMLNPLNAANFYLQEPVRAFVAMGSVVLAVTGAEALYADMGHFGRRPIKYSWLVFVMPALLVNYMGQGAMLLAQTPEQALETIKNPFFFLAPDTLRLPLVILATMATIIASQAVISGAFSVTQQAIQLGFIPRLRILHTSETAAGQIYIPLINWALLSMVILLVLMFQSSSNLAAAYGIAVTGAMAIDTVLIGVVFFSLWKWPLWKSVPLLAVFGFIDFAYFGANLLKVPAGGWFPLLVGAIAFTFLTTWAGGRKLMLDRMKEASLPIEVFIKSAAASATRVPGTAVFMTSSARGVPHALLHNLKHNKVLHERVFLLTVKIEDVPYVNGEHRVETSDYSNGFFRIILRYGFMEEVDVPHELSLIKSCGESCKMMDTSFFLSRQTLLASAKPGMAIWREKLFAWMLRNAESAMEFFKLPTNRVVELGSQVKSEPCRVPAVGARMQTILQIAAPVMIIAGALLTASNLGARITGIGFIAFTLGSILWLAIGLTVGPSSLVWQNIVLTLLNGFGIWRWLGRQRGIERGGEEASKVSEHLAGETLFPASHFAGAEVTGMDGSTLGKSVEAMIGCRSGKVAYLVVSDGGLAGVGETLRRLDWKDIDVAQDEFRSRHDQSGFSSLSSLERDHWPAR